MAYPKKFRGLLETELNDVEKPDYVWLTYAVCVSDAEACGWGGWIIEAAFASTDEHRTTGTGDKSLIIDDGQICPNCKKALFRTAASIRYIPSEDQTPIHGVPGEDYEVVPLEYE